MILTLATQLTFFRIFVSLFVLPLLIILFSPINNIFLDSFIALIFAVTAISDFFDGFIARKFGQTTIIGQVLDPFADKILLLCSLLCLVYVGRFNIFFAIIFLSREFFVSALREVAIIYNANLRVSIFAKLKTASQFLMIFFYILRPFAPYSNNIFITASQICFLTVALFFSIYSAYDYFLKFYDAFIERGNGNEI